VLNVVYHGLQAEFYKLMNNWEAMQAIELVLLFLIIMDLIIVEMVLLKLVNKINNN
jgi:hypothetical protein